ncbi:MAG: protein kinase [Anaerolineaceae bacterium]|nr:protein kinase [Anaerolineaceae bacterium]
MSPEQIMGEELDGRSDIYALGVMVFEMLTGTLPYGGNNLALIFQGHLNEPIPSVFSRVDDLPDEVDEILQKAMAKKPVDRFRKAEHLAHSLEAALQSPTAYMTSRDALVRTQEEMFNTPVGLGANPNDPSGANWPLSDTKRTPELPATVDAQAHRRWQWLAGGLGVALVIVLGLFIGSRLGSPGSATPTVDLAQVVPTTSPQETETSRPPTPIANAILALQSHESAVWQDGGSPEQFPQDGRIPFLNPVLFRTGQGAIELLLPNFTRIFLDANTTVYVETAVNDEPVRLELQHGRVLVKSENAVQVYHADGYQALLLDGIMGVQFTPADEQWKIDCLSGLCQLAQNAQAEPLELAQGESAYLIADEEPVLENTAYSSIVAYNSLDASIILPTLTPTASATPTSTATPTPTSSSTPTREIDPDSLGPEIIVLGPSAGGRDIEVVRFGNGPEVLLMVGGIHYGYAPNTVVVAQLLIDYFEDNLLEVPQELTLYIIPNLSPDARVDPGKVTGRLNGNGVDLNRNWDCRWERSPAILGQIVQGGGGTEVFSEPETQLLKNFIEENEPAAVLFWGARSGAGSVAPGACEPVSQVSAPLTHYYAIPAEHEYFTNPEVVSNADLAGDVSNWLDSIGVPAIFVLLPGFLEVDFERELAGVEGLFTAVAQPAKIQQTPTPVSCPDPVNPAWAALHATYRFQLGCAQSGVIQPLSVWQEFANGRMLWRKDTDTVYVLYNDRTLDTFVVNDPGLEGFQVSELIKGAIGYVYDNETAVATKLGAPLDQEQQAADVAIQTFRKGFIISWQDEGTQINLIFLDEGEWRIP